MENQSNHNQVTPKKKQSQEGTPKSQHQQSSSQNEMIPISNIKQVTVHTDLYPPSTQLVEQKPPLVPYTQTPSNQNNQKPPTPQHHQQNLQRQNTENIKLKERITQLENKIKYYESEHASFQSQLIAQRTQYEDEAKKLKTKLEEVTVNHPSISSQPHQEEDLSESKIKAEAENLAKEYSDQVIHNAHMQNLKEQLVQVQHQNHQQEQELIKMGQEIGLLQNEKEQMRIQIEQISHNQHKEEVKELTIISKIGQVQVVGASHGGKEKKDNEQANQQMQKLQKKMDELEQYLQEKDKVILEQENNLSELNDQNHELLKSEDSLKTQIREKQSQLDELHKQLQFQSSSWQLKLDDKDHQLKAKETTLSETLNLVTEKEIEIQRFMRQLREAEEALKEYRSKYHTMEEQYQQYQSQFQQMSDENEQIKQDFEAILSYKNELEMLIEEQTQNIEQKNKKLLMVEDTLRYKESDLEKKESLLRRMTQGADETKKKLAQAEMKMRQITQTTMRDMKVKIKDKLNEIEVLKEMVKSANKQAKAKDIDIQRLNKRIQRLEKMTELGKGIIQDGSSLPIDTNNPIMEDENEMEDTTTIAAQNNPPVNAFSTPLKQQPPIPPYPRKVNHSGDPLGLNPINYTNLAGNRSVEDEVQMELLAAQQQRHFNIKSNIGNTSNQAINRSHIGASGGNAQNFRNLKQKEIEEAMELDRMLEQERRNLSQDVFAKKYEQRLESYYNNLANAHQTNMKNHSTGVKAVFGGGGGDDENATQRNNDSLRYYDGMLPNLNLSKKEQLERELMAEINESVSRKDKYMTPNIQGKSKIVNKAYGNGGNNGSNQPYFHERNQNTSKNRIQL